MTKPKKKPKNPYAVLLGRRRASSQTKAQRKALAGLAGRTRWAKQRKAEADA